MGGSWNGYCKIIDYEVFKVTWAPENTMLEERFRQTNERVEKSYEERKKHQNLSRWEKAWK